MTQGASGPGVPDPGPPPVNWLRQQYRGSLKGVGFSPGYTGWLEFAGYATNLDLLIDFDNATGLGLFFFIEVYVQATPGSGRMTVARFEFTIPGGIIVASGPIVPGSSAWMTQAGPPGTKQFLLHVGGIGALLWGVQMAGTGKQVAVSGIAHGREF